MHEQQPYILEDRIRIYCFRVYRLSDAPATCKKGWFWVVLIIIRTQRRELV